MSDGDLRFFNPFNSFADGVLTLFLVYLQKVIETLKKAQSNGKIILFNEVFDMFLQYKNLT